MSGFLFIVMLDTDEGFAQSGVQNPSFPAEQGLRSFPES
jgi:hypothetical protein